MDNGFRISSLLPAQHATQLHTSNGHVLCRSAVTESLVLLHLHLGRIYGKQLDRKKVADGVKSILENPECGQVVVAWRLSDNRILGQVEIKKPFEVWYDTRYWYIDNHVVFPEYEGKAVGKGLLDYVRNLACAEGIERLRLYVGDKNTANRRALAYYQKYGFGKQGLLLEYHIDTHA